MPSSREKTAVVQFKTRMKERLRARLEEAANGHGISINAEIVERLERSFDRTDLLSDVLGLAYGRQAAGILVMFGEAISTLVEDGASLTDAPVSFREAAEAIITILAAIRGGAERMKEMRGNEAGALGRQYALELVHALVHAGDAHLFTPHASLDTMRSLLGPAALSRTKEWLRHQPRQPQKAIPSTKRGKS
jgi:hypothetical protein